jgi:hypothetical protein
MSGAAVRHGMYPLLTDEHCWWCADFDKPLARHVRALPNLPALGCVSVERTRSGNCAHAWWFFPEPVRPSGARLRIMADHGNVWTAAGGGA